MPGPLLEARDLVVSRAGRRVLDGVSLAVPRGAAVAIQGPSGSGKSTLVRVLATLLEPDAGQVLYEGQALPPTEHRARVAYLAQQPAMFPGTVEENLAAGPRLRGGALGREQALALLEAVHLPAALLGREARTLSGGEQQRVALARALANAPAVLLLDEPTAALDPEAGARIVALARELVRSGRSVVMVTHLEEHARALGGERLRCEGGRLA